MGSMWGRCMVDEGVDVRSIIIYEGERLVTPSSPIFYKRGALLSEFSFLSERVRFKPKMTSTGYTLYLPQGAGKYEDSEESDLVQSNCGLGSN